MIQGTTQEKFRLHPLVAATNFADGICRTKFSSGPLTFFERLLSGY
jgi:hypothetical protein